MLLPWALVTFSLGVHLAGIAYAFSYFTELSYYSTEVIHQFIKQISIDKNDEIVKKFVDKRVDRGRYFHVAGVCAALSSFLCFAIGCSLAFLALVC